MATLIFNLPFKCHSIAFLWLTIESLKIWQILHKSIGTSLRHWAYVSFCHIWIFSQFLHFDPLVRPTVTAGSDHSFRKCCPSVRPHCSKSGQIKQISSENNVRYWRDCGSGRVDHWWHLSGFSHFRREPKCLENKFGVRFIEFWQRKTDVVSHASSYLNLQCGSSSYF